MKVELDLSPDVVKWLLSHRYAPDVATSIVYVLEQTKRAEEFDQASTDMETEFPPHPEGGIRDD